MVTSICMDQNIDRLFFDLDGTLTESRQEVSNEMYDTLLKVSDKYPIVVISGASREQIAKQLKDLPYIVMAQSGNDTNYWQNRLTDNQKHEIYEHIKNIKNQYKEYFSTLVWEDLIQDRGGQISFSVLGHNADYELKKKADPKGKFRTQILKNIPFDSLTLDVKVAGTTCFDYTLKNGTKGKNIDRLHHYFKFNPSHSVYFGDALFKGGNDESVIGVIPTVKVKNPTHLISLLKYYM